MGGAVALTLAAQHAELVQRTSSLVDPLCYPAPAGFWQRLALTPVVGGFAFKQFFGRRAFRAYFREDVAGPRAAPSLERIDWHYARFNSPSARESAYAALHAVVDARAVAARVTRITTPTLVVWGRDDAIFSAAERRAARARDPRREARRDGQRARAPRRAAGRVRRARGAVPRGATVNGSPWAIAARRFTRSPAAMFGLVVAALLVLFALFGPLFAAWAPDESDFSLTRDAFGAPPGPSARHWLGTDAIFRDVASRLASGARVSLLVSIGATAVASVVGTAAGLVAGTCAGGRFGFVDATLMRVVDVLLALPFLLFVTAVGAAVGRTDVGTMVLVLGLTGWTAAARLVRRQERSRCASASS